MYKSVCSAKIQILQIIEILDYVYSSLLWCKQSTIAVYLDFASDSDINNVHATVNRELVGVDNWLKANRLSLNISKTSYMIIFNQKNSIDVRIRDSILTKVLTVKFFGITLDENLTFNDHVQNVTTKISKSVGVMSKLHCHAVTCRRNG